jgi:hypothetical protein
LLQGCRYGRKKFGAFYLLHQLFWHRRLRMIFRHPFGQPVIDLVQDLAGPQVPYGS